MFIFFGLLATSFGHYRYHQANSVQELLKILCKSYILLEEAV